MRTLPLPETLVLSGGFEAAAALVGSPDLLMNTETYFYEENKGKVAIDIDLEIDDVDDDKMSGATVTIGSFHSEEDRLDFTQVGYITGEYVIGTGILTLSGEDTIAHYQEALRSVTYENISEFPDEAERTFTFTITDSNSQGDGEGPKSFSSTRDLEVVSVNDAPVVTLSNISTINYVESTTDNATKSIQAARHLVYQAACDKDAGNDYTLSGAMAKLYASEVAMETAVEAVQIHGGNGYVKDYHVERLMRDAKITQIYEGTSEIQKIVISRSILKD